MQERNGVIYCAVLAATLATVIYRREGEHWVEPVYVSITPAEKGSEVGMSPLTACSSRERIPAPDPSHILTVYPPHNEIVKIYNKHVKEYRAAGQREQVRKHAAPTSGGIATASNISPEKKQ